MNQTLSTLSLFLIALLLSSCLITPTQRIEEYPHLYQSVPEKFRALVQSGEICNGMNENSVFLALGTPDSKSQNGNNITTWNYSRSVALTEAYDNADANFYSYNFNYGHEYENDYGTHYASDYKRDYKRDYGRNYKREFKHDFKRNFERDYKRKYMHDFKRKHKKSGYTNDYKRNLNRNFKRNYMSYCRENYQRDYKRYYRNNFKRCFEREYQDYDRLYSRTVYVEEIYAVIIFTNGRVSSWKSN